MKTVLWLALVALFLPARQESAPADFGALRARAEALHAQGSFELARKAYADALALARDPEERRYVEFRLADSRWRSAAASQNPDPTEIERAGADLAALQASVVRPEARDRIWAEVAESLGDYHWQRRDRRDFGSAEPHYRAALDWWAGARDTEVARARYLAIVWKMAWPDRDGYGQAWWLGQLPLDIVENAITIAREPRDQAQARFLFGMTVRQRGANAEQMVRAVEYLEAALGTGEPSDHANPWYDDALHTLAQWLEQQGVPDAQGQSRPDCVRALALYRRITTEFKKGDTAYFDSAEDAIRRILRKELSVSVPQAFLPDSEIGYALSWRNVERIDLALYAVDLATHVQLTSNGHDIGAGNWLARVDVSALEPVLTWTHATGDKGEHQPGWAELALSRKLPSGAYVLEVRGGNTSAREIVLVGRSALTVKTGGRRALVWFCDALTSEPIGGARVVVWERYHDGKRWKWRRSDHVTAADGTVAAELAARDGNTELFVAAVSGDRQAFSLCGRQWWSRDAQAWKVYAFTDRSTYRPGQTVEFKVIARTRASGAYATPANAKLAYTIASPHGEEVRKGVFTLNAFGSAFASLDVGEKLPLGEYQIRFEHEGAGIGAATLFRLEEYKLPEFEVSVRTGEAAGKPKLFRLGDEVEALVEARYFFGGPVADADLEVVIHQRPYWRRWIPQRDYGWYYADHERSWRGGGDGQVLQRQTLRTDGDGRATVRFPTPRGSTQDLEFTVEARVVDRSRREITGRGTVRVTRELYHVTAEATRSIHRPGDRAELRFHARDANDRGVEAEGRVKTVRSRWVEIWIDPKGREISGRELDAVQRSSEPPSTQSGWKIKFRGYESEDVAETVVRTDAQGEARAEIALASEGFYQVTWTSRDARGAEVTASSSFFCASGDTRELGYHAGGLAIIVDDAAFRAGDQAPVMLVTPRSNTWVLFSVESETLHSWQVVKVDGTAKLLTLAIGPEHVPNVFLSAFTALDGDALVDTREVVVPPVEQFLTVDIESSKPELQPGEQGQLSLFVRDHTGEPVSAEIALSLVDESVAAIQGEYAGDPRPFFFGEKRANWTQTQSSFQSKRYTKLVRREDGKLGVDRQAGVFDERERDDGGLAYGAKEEGKNGRFRGPGDSVPTGAMAKMSREMADGPSSPAPAMASLGYAGESMAQDAAANAQEPAVQVRTDFRETALWKPDLVTDARGRATVDVKYPESLTRWKATARVTDAGTRVGLATLTTRTQKPLIARLQAPRFFVVGDECFVSAVLDNRTSEPLDVRAELAIDGGLEIAVAPQSPVKVPAQGQQQLNWKVRVVRAGPLVLRLVARGGAHSDGMEKRYRVEAHGIEALVAGAWKLSEGELAVALDVPGARTKETTRFVVHVTPSVAVTMLDALPYLAGYPYGCTEQTLSRFLPAAIVARTLESRGLSAEIALQRAFGGIEEGSAAATHPSGKQALEELDRMIQQGLARLRDFQHADGGFGWWKDGDSDPFMTAYVVWGLSLARDAKIAIEPALLERASKYLLLELVDAERSPDLAAWMLHALAAYSGEIGSHEHARAAFDRLWAQEQSLNAYTRALFALAAHGFGRAHEASVLVQNLANGVIVDETPAGSRIDPRAGEPRAMNQKTAHWGEDGLWWRWSEGGVEATAMVLRALSAIDPKNELVDPTVTWLVQNRRGAQWNNTRDTAIVVLALDDYLRTSGELAREVEYELSINGTVVAKRRLSPADMLAAPAEFVLPPESVRDGRNDIRLACTAGAGPLYLSARATFTSLEEPIPARGSQLFARRQYFKYVGRPTLLKGYVYDKVPLEDGGTVASGERVEVVLTVETKNHFDYLLFEDLKPAGLEAVQLLSGEHIALRELRSSEVDHRFGANVPALVPDPNDSARYTGRAVSLHQELRDRQVALFADHLPQGVWEVRYDLRAEVPGRFHALPVLAQAMYVPEVRGNSDELRITIRGAERHE
ncbi:MAG: alpha-2-macroglobulin family protein [Planctomycetota bacterium]